MTSRYEMLSRTEWLVLRDLSIPTLHSIQKRALLDRVILTNLLYYKEKIYSTDLHRIFFLKKAKPDYITRLLYADNRVLNGKDRSMWLKHLMSSKCCGGPVLALTLMCLTFGLLFVGLSAVSLGVVFVAAGGMAEGLCLLLGRTRCRNRLDDGQRTAN